MQWYPAGMRRTAFFMIVLACMALARPAWAAASGAGLDSRTIGEYKQQDPQSGGISPLFGMTVSVLLVAAIVSASLIPSKRGHQD